MSRFILRYREKKNPKLQSNKKYNLVELIMFFLPMIYYKYQANKF